ncbi:hypothetical protein [Azohydromonas caseinilytica]|uniref:Uncharacterized protein n=1 Tax=Azohydromonas caseinilytica TaxID=2728836 RepID=A0A848FHW1_9BURK|nr:hypothetical protein [Azohydromonas caseinilytica]NML18736.1 hypothetical protein [Azohydromonas caseinilytica]
MSNPSGKPNSTDLDQPEARKTGELNTQAGSRMGQDQLSSTNLGRHGQQMQGSVGGSPSADQADPAWVGNRQEAWQQAQPGQQLKPDSLGQQGQEQKTPKQTR